MKHARIAVCLLALTLGFCIAASVLVRRYSLEVTEAIAESERRAAQSDFRGAAAQLHEARQRWHRHERFFGVVLSHSELDDVNMMFAELAQYAALGDRDDYLAGTARLAAAIGHIREMQLPSYHNLL